jgi:hypothetical protein
MQVNDNAQQVHAMIAPAKARSPSLKVRMEHHALGASLKACAKKQRRLQAKSQWDEKKISDLKAHNNQLLQDILQECRASNKIIDEAMSEACKLSREAVEMINEANAKINDANKRITAERTHASTKICEERVFQSSQSARLDQKLEDSLNKHQREHESSMKILVDKHNKMYQQVQMNMVPFHRSCMMSVQFGKAQSSI